MKLAPIQRTATNKKKKFEMALTKYAFYCAVHSIRGCLAIDEQTSYIVQRTNMNILEHGTTDGASLMKVFNPFKN